MSTIGKHDTGSAWEVGGRGVAMVVALVGEEVTGGDYGCSASSSPSCCRPSSIVSISINYPKFFSFLEDSPSIVLSI